MQIGFSAILVFTIIAYLAGLTSENQSLSAFIAGFFVYAIPRIERVIISSAALLNDAVVDYMKG